MNSNSVKLLLQQFPLFRSLTENEINLIVRLAVTREYKKDSHIFFQGDPLTDVYFIFSGKIKIYRLDAQGNEQIVNILKKGDMFPHQGFFRKDSYPANAQAMEDAVLIYIPIQSFEQFLIRNPEVCIKIFRILGEQIMELHQRLEEKILYNTYDQILLLLLRLTKKHGKKLNEQEFLISTLLTNRDLANMIGSSRETVNRTLSQLKKRNFIRYEDGYIVTRPDKLREELI